MIHPILKILLPLTLILASCSREEQRTLAELSAASEVSLSVSGPGFAGVKSVIEDEGFENDKKNVLYCVIGSDGSYKWAYIDASAAPGGSFEKCFSLALDGSIYTVYAFVNMGDIRDDIPLLDGVPLPEEYVYELPDSYAQLASMGMPMAGKATIFPAAMLVSPSVPLSLTISVSRLLSGISVTVSKADMHLGASSGEGLESGKLAVRQVPKLIRPFAPGGSRALSTDELYPGDTDYYIFTDANRTDLSTSSITFYVPENCQGTASIHSQDEKVPGNAGEAASLATYLEYTARKVGTSDGVSSQLVSYKVYLGGNETSDFNLLRNSLYNVGLSLSWDGLWYGDWRVDVSDFSAMDLRRLVISSAADSFTAIGPDVQKVRRNVGTDFYLNYSVDGGSNAVHGRRGLTSWPYGYEIWIDGEKESAAASSGTFATWFDWEYDSSTDRLTLQAKPGAPSGDDHTLQIRSVDGRVVSNVVNFSSLVPLGLQWSADGVPAYVAQRGKLIPVDLDDPSAPVSYSVKVGAGKASVAALPSGNAGAGVVSLLGATAPGETVTIHAECEATGQTDDMEITVSAPTLLSSMNTWYANADGTPACSGKDGLSGTPLKTDLKYVNSSQEELLVQDVADGTGLALGTNLADDLYSQTLAIQTSLETLCSADIIRADISLNPATHKEEVSVYSYAISNGFTSLYPDSVTSDLLGSVRFSAKSPSSGVSPVSVSVKSVPPFPAYTTWTRILSPEVSDWSLLYAYRTRLQGGVGYPSGTPADVPASSSVVRFPKASPSRSGVAIVADYKEVWRQDVASAPSVEVSAGAVRVKKASGQFNVSWKNFATGAETYSIGSRAGDVDICGYITNTASGLTMYRGQSGFRMESHCAIGAKACFTDDMTWLNAIVVPIAVTEQDSPFYAPLFSDYNPVRIGTSHVAYQIIDRDDVTYPIKEYLVLGSMGISGTGITSRSDGQMWNCRLYIRNGTDHMGDYGDSYLVMDSSEKNKLKKNAAPGLFFTSTQASENAKIPEYGPTQSQILYLTTNGLERMGVPDGGGKSYGYYVFHMFESIVNNSGGPGDNSAYWLPD